MNQVSALTLGISICGIRFKQVFPQFILTRFRFKKLYRFNIRLRITKLTLQRI